MPNEILDISEVGFSLIEVVRFLLIVIPVSLFFSYVLKKVFSWETRTLIGLNLAALLYLGAVTFLTIPIPNTIGSALIIINIIILIWYFLTTKD